MNFPEADEGTGWVWCPDVQRSRAPKVGVTAVRLHLISPLSPSYSTRHLREIYAK